MKQIRLQWMKRVLPIFLAVFLTISLISGIRPASAATSSIVALGDSITTGWGLPNVNSQLYVNKLADKMGASCTNLAVDGTTSSELLAMLHSLNITKKTQIKNANVIVVSIGGNNLLGAFLSALENKLGKDVSDASEDEISKALAAILIDKGAQNQLETAIGEGRDQFLSDFPKILAILNSLNPSAEIVVQTVYNPIYNISALRSLNTMGEAVMSAMNSCIQREASAGNCLVADVYTAFKVSSDNGVTPVNTANFDIHPNATGHNMIYQSVYFALTGKSPYSMTADVTGASVNFVIAPSSMVARIEFTPKTGYTLPEKITVKIGDVTQTLTLSSGKVYLYPFTITNSVIVSGTAVSNYKTALPTKSTVYIDGTAVRFQAYNIDGYNYFKLRDLAAALSGSEKQFEVSWNGATNTITLTSGTPYTTVGGELMIPGSVASQTVLSTTSKMYLDGAPMTLTAYNICDNNYFKLRDVAAALDFGVSYDATTNSIDLVTSEGYVAP